MLTGRAGWATLHLAFHPKDGETRADALKRIAAEYGPGFAENIADSIETQDLLERNRADAIRIARNARRRRRAAKAEPSPGGRT